MTDLQKLYIKLFMQGLDNAEIAKEMLVEERTVKFHFQNFRKKFGVKNNTQLMRVLYQANQGGE